MQLKTVFRALNSGEAQLVRSQLEAAEFDVFVADESSALAVECHVLGVGGIRVQVPEDREASAREFLQSCGHLVNIKTLETLTLKRTEISEAGLERLRKALPDCEITDP